MFWEQLICNKQVTLPSECKYCWTAVCRFSFPAEKAGKYWGSLKASAHTWCWLNADGLSGSSLQFYALPVSQRLLLQQQYWLSDIWNTCVCIYEPNCKNGAESHKPALVAAKILVAEKHEQWFLFAGCSWGAVNSKNDCHSKRGREKVQSLFSLGC